MEKRGTSMVYIFLLSYGKYDMRENSFEKCKRFANGKFKWKTKIKEENWCMTILWCGNIKMNG